MKINLIMKAVVTAAAIFAATAYAQARQVTAVIHEGAEIHLQDDGSWSFAKPAVISSNANGESFITLRDGRILKLNSDFTYEFVRSQPTSTNSARTYPAISVGSSAVGTNVDQVANKAMEEVFNSAAAQLRKFIPTRANQKKAQMYLVACIKDEVKNHEVAQTTKQNGSQWEVDMKLEISEVRSQKIIECLEYQLQ